MSDREPEIERLVDEFDLLWQKGESPKWTEWLKGRVQPAAGEQLADKLVPIELEYRVRRGDQITPERDYPEASAKQIALVHELLAALLDENATLAPKPKTPPRVSAPSTASQLIGPYKLLQKLGEGGMGEVWMAEQREPVKRRVALKLIKGNASGSREVLARFDAERQALALMNHPNIARILDAGTTPEGNPFFVMELVAGLPITQFCDKNQLPIEERLNLFREVCGGVQHAHQKGIIHRDLKPGNIIVGQIDGRPVAKIIDFGLAKALESASRLTDQSLYTGIGQILGTLKYMSPEQASLDLTDIDTRTDIYALGVILYELLTGSTPLDDDQIRGQAALKLLELIREQEPARPSSKLSHSNNDTVTALTAKRRIESGRLSRILAGDLDWVVMKALEKDRTRRYESASSMAADIERFLTGEPVVARPPSLEYRIRKFVGKHRVGVIAASSVFLALIGGFIGTSLSLVRALSAEQLAEQRLGEIQISLQRESQALIKESAERQRAEGAEQKALAAQRKAEDALASEQRERKFAEAISTFVKDDFLALTSVEGQERFGGKELGRDARLSQLLERAAKKLAERTDLEPRIEAELNWIIGINFRGSGHPQKGIPFLQHAVELYQSLYGADSQATLNAMNSLAVCYNAAGATEEALKISKQTMEARERLLGPEHPDTLSSARNLALLYDHCGQSAEALPMLEKVYAVKLRTRGIDDPSTLTSLMDLAVFYLDSNQAEKSAATMRAIAALKSIPVGEEAALTPTAESNSSVQLMELCVKLFETALGQNHSSTLMAKGDLAVAYQQTGQIDKSIALLQLTLQQTTEKFGPEHPETIDQMGQLGTVYSNAELTAQAIPLLTRALELSSQSRGPDHPETLVCMNVLAHAYDSAGEPAKALPLFERTLALRKSELGPEHPLTMSSMSNFARILWSVDRPDEAIPIYENLLELQIRTLGRKHPKTEMTIANLGVNYRDAGRLEEALPLLEEAVRASQENTGLLWVRESLRDAYVLAKNTESFAELAEEDLATARAEFANNPGDLAELLIELGNDYLTLGQDAIAEELLREGCELLQVGQKDEWKICSTQSLLGKVLLKRGKTNEAETLLVTSFEKLLQLEGVAPEKLGGQVSNALDRLIQYYEAVDNLEQLQKYRDLKEKRRNKEVGPAQ